jgi:hypothetical protein
MKILYTFILFFICSNAHGALFEDEEARRAILDLRQKMELHRQAQSNISESIINSFKRDKTELNDQIERLKTIQFEQNKILNDVIYKQKSILFELEKIQQNTLQIQNQIDNLKK